jgi:uncharacterized protein YndB with AHSA1/START domain
VPGVARETGAVTELRVQMEVAAPIHAVFDLFADAASWERWAGIHEVVVRQEGHPVPGGLGCTCVMRSSGVAVETEVTHYERPWRLRYNMVGGLPVRRYEGDLQLFERGENTQLVWRVTFVPWVPGTGPLLASMIRREIYPFELPGQAYPEALAAGGPAEPAGAPAVAAHLS